MADYGPSLQACKLWQKTSVKGVTYYTGRLGGLKVTILPNRNKMSDDDATHVMLLGEAQPYQPPAARAEIAAHQAKHVAEQAPSAARCDPPRPVAPKQGTSRDMRKQPPRSGPKQMLPEDAVPF